MVSLCSPGYLKTHYVDQAEAELKLRYLSLSPSVSELLGLKMTGNFGFKILVFVERSISSCLREGSHLGSTEDETGSQTNLTAGSAVDQYKTAWNVRHGARETAQC